MVVVCIINRGASLFVVETELAFVAEHLHRVERYGIKATPKILALIESEKPRAVNLAVRSCFSRVRPGGNWFKATPKQMSEIRLLFKGNRLQIWEGPVCDWVKSQLE